MVGEEAHIASKRPNGPRYDDLLAMDRRDFFENLLLLCNRCHKIVDDQERTYTAAVLRRLKKEHEDEVRGSLSAEDAAKNHHDIVYADYIEHWEQACDLDCWSAWTSYLLCADAPSMRVAHKDQLVELRRYLMNRVWPHRYSDLERGFELFRRILDDLLKEFLSRSTYYGVQNENIVTEKFYKTRGWLEQEEYRKSLDAYVFHTDTLRDLTLELTRAANYISDLIREHLLPEYRVAHGRLTVSVGPFEDMTGKVFVPEYSCLERTRINYEGLKSFLDCRSSRDYAAGKGTEPIRGYADGLA